MKETLEMLVKSLVDNTDKVEITEKENGDDVTLEIRVDSSDMGKIIGKQGRIAKAIRVLMKAYATKMNKKVSVEILD
ncbi:MAG: KH domain-containing protein [Clostridia bacterium]|nr:KH domain-containing protein [Clostridia bacterium]